MKYSFIVILTLLFGITIAQETGDSITKNAPRIFLDCDFCDTEYTRQNVTYLNYVRDRKVADVHILAYRQRTGAGGWEETFEFNGHHQFEGQADTLLVIIDPNATSDEKRILETQLIELGIIRYAAQTPIAKYISIGFDQPVEPSEVDDPWKNWVFEVGANGWFNGQSSYSSINGWAYASAEKVTPEVRMSLGLNANHNESRFEFEDETITSLTRSKNVNAEYVKSISNHLSWAIFGGAGSSLFANKKFRYDFNPSFEYNVFPYDESSKRQLRMNYGLTVGQNFYNDTTIYNKIEENIFSHSLSIAYRNQQQWGNVSMGISAYQYLHDLNLYSINTNAGLSLRVFKGFNFNINGNFSIIRNQISLPKSGLSEEDVLLRQRQQATNFSYWGNVGISYTFGSIYNSIVNPRFGG